MQADITYTRDTGEKLVNETFGPNNIRRRITGAEERHRVEIANGREARGLGLDANGFVLVEHRPAVRDFFDADELKRVYYPEVEALISRVAGARRVVVFDHTLRSGSEDEREAKLIREPVLSAHNDYTEWSGPQRVRDLMGAAAEKLLERRFAIIQVWRAAYANAADPAEVQPGPPLVLFPRDAPRRGDRVQGLRLGEGRARPLHPAHLVRRPGDAARRAAAAEHRGARLSLLLAGARASSPARRRANPARRAARGG